MPCSFQSSVFQRHSIANWWNFLQWSDYGLLAWIVAPAHPALHSSEDLLDWVHLRSVLRNCDAHNAFLQEELIDRLSQMNGCIIENEEELGLEFIIILLVRFMQSSFQLNQKVQELQITVCPHSQLGVENPIIQQSADCSGSWFRLLNKDHFVIRANPRLVLQASSV